MNLPGRISTPAELRRIVKANGPLVPVSIAAKWEGVTPQAIRARANMKRWLVDGLVMVPISERRENGH